MLRPLTKKQAAIYQFIASSIATNGYAPSFEEIGRQFELSSLATIAKHLDNLQDKGYIARDWNRSRSIRLLVLANTCPTCGQAMPVLPSGERTVS